MSWNSRGTSFGPVLRNSRGTSFGPVPNAVHMPLLVGSQNDAAAEAPSVSRHASPGVLPLPPRAGECLQCSYANLQMADLDDN